MGLVVGLAGCRLDVDVATTVDASGAGMVKVTIRADGELVAAAPGVVADLRLDDLRTAGWTVTGPAPATDGAVSLTLSKGFTTPEQATRVLAEIGPPLRDVVVAQAATFARLETTVNGQVVGPQIADFADAELVQALGGVPLADRVTPEQLAAGIGMTVRFSLPGDVVSTDGVEQGGTVTWQPVMAPGVVTPLTVVAEQRDEEADVAADREDRARLGLWVWLGVVGLGLLVGGVIWWWRRRRRRRSAALS